MDIMDTIERVLKEFPHAVALNSKFIIVPSCYEIGEDNICLIDIEGPTEVVISNEEFVDKMTDFIYDLAK